MAIDPSGRGDNETAYVVVKMLNGYLYVTAAGGVKGGGADGTPNIPIAINRVTLSN